MGTDVTGVIETVPSPRDIKVHRLMCTRLMILVDRILKIFPDIEVSRPRCSSGIQALCLLNRGIEKAHLLFQHCSESSKLYLAITGDAILSRCLKSRNLLEQSLSQIENNVPVMLAAEISRIISDIRGAIFSLDSSEEAAGKALRELLQQFASSRPADAKEKSAIKAIRFAALRLKITTQKDLLIEKRSIKKLLDKVGDVDLAKRQILLFLVSLLKQYGSLIVREQAENSYVQHEESISFASSYNASSVESCAEHGPDEVKMDMLSRCVPPEEFKCPISLRLMYDPVVIASGQTFERMWIQKWLDEGHDTCPKTKQKLLHLSLTPNVVMKDLISKWCRDNGITIPDPCVRSTAVHSLETSLTSIASLSNSMNNLRLPLDLSNISLGSLDGTNPDSSHVKITDISDLVSVQTKDRSQRIQSCPKTHEKSKCSLNNLDELPWVSQCEAVDDAKRHLEHCDHASNFKSLENFVEPLIQFLKHAYDLHDVKAQRSGTWLLLEFVRMYRSSEPPLHEEAYSLLALLLNSEVTEEALTIMEVLSRQGRCIPKITASGAPYSILNMLERDIREFHGPAIKILFNLSSTREIRSLFVPSEFIPWLVPFFEDADFAEYCISILKNLCDSEDARDSIAKTDGCMASIAKVLETGSPEAQEHAVAVLISLCSHRIQYCYLVMDEVAIPVLNSIKTTGNERGKASAMELLRILRDVDYDHEEECLGSDAIQPKDSNNHCNKKKSSGIFGTKISIFSKPSFPALKKKK